MHKLKKALQKLSLKEREIIKNIISQIKLGSLSGFDLKKLKNQDNIFRIRKGSLRIIFQKKDDGQYFILTIERRSDKTYDI